VLKISSTQKKYKICNDAFNGTNPKLPYHETILKEKLSELRNTNNDLYKVIDHFIGKYPQYTDLFEPILTTHTLNSQL
jgi:hypothetical protein